jgi:hypothetical protein
MKKLIVPMLLVVAVATWGWRWMHKSDAPAPKLLFDRFWVDHQPRDDHEKFQAMFVSGEHPFGHFATRTVWTGAWEGFHYHLVPREEAAMDMLFGHTREMQRVRWTAQPCHDGGFDFCLEIAGASRGVKRYYSRREWGVRSAADAEGIAQSLATSTR